MWIIETCCQTCLTMVKVHQVFHGLTWSYHGHSSVQLWSNYGQTWSFSLSYQWSSIGFAQLMKMHFPLQISLLKGAHNGHFIVISCSQIVIPLVKLWSNMVIFIVTPLVKHRICSVDENAFSIANFTPERCSQWTFHCHIMFTNCRSSGQIIVKHGLFIVMNCCHQTNVLY